MRRTGREGEVKKLLLFTLTSVLLSVQSTKNSHPLNKPTD